MRRSTVLAAIVVATAIASLIAIGPALAAAPDGPGPWADYVVAVHQGPAINPSGPVLPERSDPTQALGPAESPPGPNNPPPNPPNWFSLGFGGSITLGFDNPICNAPGADLAIEMREITQEPWPPEVVQVYVSEDGVNFLLAGTVNKDGFVAMPPGITVANFVKVVDISNPADFAPFPFADGYDLDGVRAVSAACPPGKIEICKAAFNGMTNRPFQFSLNGGSPITVRGGRCSGPITSIPGVNTVRELPTTPGTDVSAITVRPSGRLLSQDLGARTAVVRVVSGSTAATESRVTFTNVPAGGLNGDLKICKLSETPAYWGRLFTFHVNGGPGFSTEANPAFDPPSSWSCRLAGSFRQGTRVTIKEDIPAGTQIAFIDTDPADRLTDFDTNAGTATVTIGSGATVVLYDDEPLPPAALGFLEVCKDPAHLDDYRLDRDVKGPFDFLIDEADGSSQTVTVLAGQCSASIPVAAGIARVTEVANPDYTLVDAFTIPEERLLDSNLINRTVDVEVPVSSDESDETQVHFVNRRNRGQLKVCKALGPGSEALQGREFIFNVVDLDGFQRDPLNPRVIAASTPQCVIVGDFPVGHQVDISEQNPGDYVTTTGEGTITIQPGINSATITNTARGKLEICKFLRNDEIKREAQPEFDGTSDHQFVFRIDNTTMIKVRANTCSPPQLVSVGQHTVTEVAEQNYELDPDAPGNGIVVTPPDAEVSRSLLGRTVTVDVPWAGDPDFELGREVRIDFYNRAKRAQIKICKHISPGSEDALGSKEFTFAVSVSTGAGPYQVKLRPGECALLREPDGTVASFPVVTGSTMTSAVASEAIDGPFHVSDITVQGGRGFLSPPCSGTGTARVCNNTVNWYLGPNTNTVHFTNTANDP